MAVITFPSKVPIRFSIQLSYPGQVVHTAISTGKQQVITSGVGVWGGALTINHVERTTRQDIVDEIHAFISRIEGATNTTYIPIYPRPMNALPQGSRLRVIAGADGVRPDAVVRSTNFDIGVRLVTSSGEDIPSTTGLAGLNEGAYINFGESLHRLTAPLVLQSSNGMSTGTLSASPRKRDFGVADVGADFTWEHPFVHARLGQGGGLLTAVGFHFVGPWLFQWGEAI